MDKEQAIRYVREMLVPGYLELECFLGVFVRYGVLDPEFGTHGLSVVVALNPQLEEGMDPFKVYALFFTITLLHAQDPESFLIHILRVDAECPSIPLGPEWEFIAGLPNA